MYAFVFILVVMLRNTCRTISENRGTCILPVGLLVLALQNMALVFVLQSKETYWYLYFIIFFFKLGEAHRTGCWFSKKNFIALNVFAARSGQFQSEKQAKGLEALFVEAKVNIEYE